MTANARDTPRLGLGLRPPFYAAAARGEIPVDWFEVITENFMVEGGKPLRVLADVREHYPIAFHGVSMNLGGTDPLDRDYLARLKQLVDRYDPVSVSDHLCWTRHDGVHLHDLLPLPYAEDVVEHVAARIREVQDTLGRQILIENVSSYAELALGSMTEHAFLRGVAEQADCLILLDLNNMHVSAVNHGFDPSEYLSALPARRVAQHHLAGHSGSAPLLIDTHDHPVCDAVWALYAEARRAFGPVPVCLERDDHYPALAELLREIGRVRAGESIDRERALTVASA